MGQKNHPNCNDNILKAAKPFGMKQEDLHEPFNIWMKTSIDRKTYRLHREKVAAKKGDYIDLYADMDLIIAISACPIGSSIMPPDPRPLKIEIFSCKP